MAHRPSATFYLWQSLSPLDFIVFFAVLALTFVAMYWAEKRKKKSLSDKNSVLDLILMGRQLTLPLFTMNLVTSWYGGLFGVTQITYEDGIYNFLIQGIFWYITYLIFALFLVPKLRRSGAVTLPDLAGQYFGPRSARIAGFFNFFNILPISYALSLGLLLQLLFGGELWWWIAGGTILVALYSLIGGLRAIVYSDFIQFVVMCSSVFMLALCAYQQFGGMTYLSTHLPATHLQLSGKYPWSTTLVWGFIALSTLVDPCFYQRVFAAKNQQTAQWGIIVATLIWIAFDLCTTAGALYARAAFPHLKSDQSYLYFAMYLLPAGLKGYFLAGVLATIVSTLESFLLIAGNTLSFDLGPKSWRWNLKSHQLSIFAAGLVTIMIAIYFQQDGVRGIWKILGSYSAGCLLFPMILGHLSASGKQLLSDQQFTLMTMTSMVIMTLSQLNSFEVEPLYVGLSCSIGWFIIFCCWAKIKIQLMN